MANSELGKEWFAKSRACVLVGVNQRAFERDLQPLLPDDKLVRRGRSLFVHLPSLVAAMISRVEISGDSIKAERLKKLKLENEKIALDVEEKKRLLCRVEELERVWAKMALPFRRVTDELRKSHGDGAARIWQSAVDEADRSLEEFLEPDSDG